MRSAGVSPRPSTSASAIAAKTHSTYVLSDGILRITSECAGRAVGARRNS